MENANVLDREFMELLKTMTVNYNITLKDGNLGGNRSKAKGSSVEFSDYREYIPGDDFRRIDWNALARFEKVFIKLFMEEREAPVTIFVDKSSSMNFDMKREAAIKAAATFIFSALREYDSVSTVMFDKGAQVFEVNLKGQAAFNKLAKILQSTPFSKESNLYDTIYSWQPRFRKGITVIISDLMYDARLDEVLKLLTYKKQKTILCHVLSENELYPTFEGNLRIIDSETNDYMDILAGSEAVNLYQQTLLNYMNQIKETCLKYRVEYFLINSNEPIEGFLKQLHRMQQA